MAISVEYLVTITEQEWRLVENNNGTESIRLRRLVVIAIEIEEEKEENRE